MKHLNEEFAVLLQPFTALLQQQGRGDRQVLLGEMSAAEPSDIKRFQCKIKVGGKIIFREQP